MYDKRILKNSLERNEPACDEKLICLAPALDDRHVSLQGQPNTILNTQIVLQTCTAICNIYKHVPHTITVSACSS